MPGELLSPMCLSVFLHLFLPLLNDVFSRPRCGIVVNELG